MVGMAWSMPQLGRGDAVVDGETRDGDRAQPGRGRQRAPVEPAVAVAVGTVEPEEIPRLVLGTVAEDIEGLIGAVGVAQRASGGAVARIAPIQPVLGNARSPP